MDVWLQKVVNFAGRDSIMPLLKWRALSVSLSLPAYTWLLDLDLSLLTVRLMCEYELLELIISINQLVGSELKGDAWITRSLHGVEKHVCRATGGIWLSLSAHVRVIALVPFLVTKVIYFTDVVTTVEWAAMMRDPVKLILCCLSFTCVVCTKIQINSSQLFS